MMVLPMGGWVFYLEPDEAKKLDRHKCGKWMYFFGDRAFAEKICQTAVEQGVVVESKHSDDAQGVCCFYLEIDDMAAHKRVIDFFIENNLIRKTKAGKLYNISFKLDDQTRNGEYGSDFKAELKLSEFINLETGEWIKE